METWTLGLDDEFLAHTYSGNWRTTQAVGFFPSRGAFFREFRHSAQQGRSMDFRQFAGVGVNQLRARNSRGNNGQDPELGTTAILPGVRSREQGLYTGSVYPAFTGLQVCIQLFCTPHHAFLQCQLYILRCLLRDRDSVSPPPRTARASFEVRLFPPPSSDELKVVEDSVTAGTPLPRILLTR